MDITTATEKAFEISQEQFGNIVSCGMGDVQAVETVCADARDTFTELGADAAVCLIAGALAAVAGVPPSAVFEVAEALALNL